MKILNYLVIIFICINHSVKADSKKTLIDELQKGGKLIFPLPLLHIVDKSNYKHYLKRNLADFAFKF